MGKIYIIGLGPGNIDTLTMGAVNRMNSGAKNFLRTKEHPTVKYLDDNNIEYESYDYLYKTMDSFDKVYSTIVGDLLKKLKEYGEINYYVPGNPFVAEKTVELLMKEDIELEIISGMSFIEPMLELVERDPINGLKIVDGDVFKPSMIDINVDIIVTQVYNHRILSDIKLILSEVYGDEYMVYLVHGAGISEVEKLRYIPIFELDRDSDVGSLTSIYIPKIEENQKKVFDFNDLLDIMLVLRSEDGCPWDIKQTHESIRNSVIEEAYELVDAINSGDIDNIVEELGDILLQVVFHSQIAFENGDFNIYDVTSELGNKLIYRHPHVFSNKMVENGEEVVYNWDVLKYKEREISTLTDKLRDIKGLPALMTSFKLQQKAGQIGFDFESIEGPIEKVKEEFAEVLQAYERHGVSSKYLEEEVGDLLFAVVNLSRFLKIDPEVALVGTMDKFINRLEYIEKELLKIDKKLEDSNLEEMDSLWNEAKTNLVRE